MDCSNPRFYSLLLNQLFLVLYVADYFYLNLILCTFPYNIVPYWFMSVSSIYHNQLALWNVCDPISSYHVLGLSSVLIFLCLFPTLYISFIPVFIGALENVSPTWSCSLGKYFMFDKCSCNFAILSWCVGGVLHSGFHNVASNDL